MASVFESAPAPLKGKLNHVRNLLEGANKRLQEEASKYEIFTSTKPGLRGEPLKSPNAKQNGHTDVPNDLRRTITDISTIQSVLSCPIFNRIVNVTDSLDQLSYHLNLRPSIGPADINISSDGELILEPPLEQTTINNLINSRIDDFSNTSQSNSPKITNLKEFGHRNITDNVDRDEFITNMMESNHAYDSDIPKQDNKRHQSKELNNQHDEIDSRNNIAPIFKSQIGTVEQPDSLMSTTSTNSNTQKAREFCPEKLVTNRNGPFKSEERQHRNQPGKVQALTAAFENHRSESNGNHRMYGNNELIITSSNQPIAENRKFNIADTASNQIITETSNDDASQTFGYTNDMYNATHELTNSVTHNDVVDYKRQSLSELNDYSNNIVKPINGSSTNKRVNNTQRASPSTSASSTVPLADDCDSGTSSFRSQAAKCAKYPLHWDKPITRLDKDQADPSLDQELIDKVSPDVEQIKVTLEKDSNGLGIKVAGYKCSKVEISGIFIKSIVPDSPADRCGEIRILDQIVSINGQEILGFNNEEAVNFIRNNSCRVVTLELMRFVTESKYRKLQELLNRATLTSDAHIDPSNDAKREIEIDKSREKLANFGSDILRAQPALCSTSPQNNLQPEVTNEACTTEPIESMYNNTSVFFETNSRGDHEDGSKRYSNQMSTMPIVEHQTPVAAQRGAPTNKVIEIKQGGRNTIEIKLPMVSANQSDDSRSIVDRQRRDATEEFGQLVKTEKLEWERDVQIIELNRDSSQSLGFTVKDYANPEDKTQSIFMIVHITPCGIAERDGRLAVGDLLVFVDDTNLEGTSPNEAIRALKRTNGQVRLGVLKYKRSY